MKALIIGADKEIGLSFTKYLNELGYELIIVGKNKNKLNKIKETINNIETICIDVASIYNCKKLFTQLSKDDIDMVINCNDLKSTGSFMKSTIDEDVDLLDINIKSVHTLTKLFLSYFEARNKGYLLNLVPCDCNKPYPKMATYMASKSYILKLTQSIIFELKKKNKDVYIGCFCDKNPNNVNLVVEQMLKGKNYIKN